MSKKEDDEDEYKDEDNDVKFYATSEGRIYVKAEEFFRSRKIQKMIKEILASKMYKDIEEKGYHKLR
jgi:hypothetical protein